MPFDTYNLGCYILDRLTEVGCEHLFGVPGDFNLRFLDDAMVHDIKWVGCANELNMAYATDGYARIHGVGAMVTTYGVGELSALNGVAGSASESVPVIHIVGAPSTEAQQKRQLLHHSLGDGKFLHFLEISDKVCCAAAMLSPENATAEVDRVITDVLYYKKPGYIALPSDLTVMSVKPPAAKLVARAPEKSLDSIGAFRKAVTESLSQATHPSVLVGHLVERFQLSKQTNHFFSRIRIPFSVATMGKGAVNEHVENFVGTYIAGDSPCPAKTVVEAADVCILLGVQLTDTVTGNFSSKINMSNAIVVNPFDCKVGEQCFPQVPMQDALDILEDVCFAFHARWDAVYPIPEAFPAPDDPQQFDSAHFWGELQSALQPNDIVVVDLGSAAFSSILLRLPDGARYMCPFMWGAIGYALPAALGIQIAAPDRRVICVVGDGAAQMSIQEIGTYTRNNLNSTIFLLNNDGYTIERYIRGTYSEYNDVAKWNWTALVKGFCTSPEPDIQVIDRVGEVAAAMKHREKDNTRLFFAEVITDMMDGPLRTPVPLPVQKPKKKK